MKNNYILLSLQGFRGFASALRLFRTQGGLIQTDKLTKMKKNIHPTYGKVIFLDTSNNHSFLTQSTIQSEETLKWEDGNAYPLVKVEVSATSHPFYTGKKIYVDTAGRVEKFHRRYGKKSVPQAETPTKKSGETE